MKYPIGIQDFEKIINGSYVYVDKTDFIYRLVTEGILFRIQGSRCRLTIRSAHRSQPMLG